MIDWHNIEDMPFYRAVQSEKEADQIIQYCINDVKSTEHLFNINKKEIELRINLGAKYNTNFLNASNSKIGSDLMLKLYCQKTGRNPYEVRRLRTERSVIKLKEIIFPYIKFDSDEFSQVLEHFNNKVIKIGGEDKDNYSLFHKGLEYVYGMGGVHAAIPNIIVEPNKDEIIISCDVASLYPSIAAVNNLYPHHLGQEFADIYGNDILAVRLTEKAKGKDGDQTIIAGYKESLNSCYGKSNDKYSWMYDPLVIWRI